MKAACQNYTCKKIKNEQDIFDSFCSWHIKSFFSCRLLSKNFKIKWHHGIYLLVILYNPGMELGGAEEMCADSFHTHLKQV